MPSLALHRWRTGRAASLDAFERAHRSVGGTAPGTRHTAQQINQAYAVLLSSQFQGFCRDLHTECALAVARILPSADLQDLMAEGLLRGRKLDTGNPNPGNIGADFNRFGLEFWPAVDLAHSRNAGRKSLLEELNRWRNAIGHDDFEPAMMRRGQPNLALAEVRRWRKACHHLARWFDQVMQDRLRVVIGINPW